jgi:hypothetical protein
MPEAVAPLAPCPPLQVWGSNVELPSVTRKQAEESYLNATSVSRAVTPPTGLANEARNDMVKNRIDYVSTNLRPASQYVVMGKAGAVAPVAVSQGEQRPGSRCMRVCSWDEEADDPHSLTQARWGSPR